MPGADEDSEDLYLLYPVATNTKWCSHLGSQLVNLSFVVVFSLFVCFFWQFLTVNHTLFMLPGCITHHSNALNPQRNKSECPLKTCTLYVYSTLFLIANSWKQPKPAGTRRRTLGSVFRTVLVLDAVHSLT